MTTSYGELAERIRGELTDLESAVNRSLRSWDQASRAGDGPDAYLDSVALNRHSFYTGLERLFELVARHVDHASPSGDIPAKVGNTPKWKFAELPRQACSRRRTEGILPDGAEVAPGLRCVPNLRGYNWHRELVCRMTGNADGARAAVISAGVAERLGEFRRFRHVVRNVCAFNLVSERMTGLRTWLPELGADLQRELSAFAEYLGRVAHALTDGVTARE